MLVKNIRNMQFNGQIFIFHTQYMYIRGLKNFSPNFFYSNDPLPFFNFFSQYIFFCLQQLIRANK